MADTTLTAADVKMATLTGYTAFASEAISAGEIMEMRSNKWKLLDTTDTTVAQRYGMAANPCAVDQPVTGMNDIDITVKSGEVTDGDYYFGSDNKGKMTSLESDISTGRHVIRIGYGAGATTFRLEIKATGRTAQ